MWTVGAKGGDDVLKTFTVSRPAGISGREWVLDNGLVRVWDERDDAQKYCDRLNKENGNAPAGSK